MFKKTQQVVLCSVTGTTDWAIDTECLQLPDCGQQCARTVTTLSATWSPVATFIPRLTRRLPVTSISSTHQSSDTQKKKNTPQFMHSECSLPSSQDLVTCPYPEPDQPSPRPPTHPWTPSHLCLDHPNCPFLTGSPSPPPRKKLHATLPSPIRATSPAHFFFLESVCPNNTYTVSPATANSSIR